MTELGNLPNIWKVLEENLRTIGVTTEEQLKEKGTEQLFFEIRQKVDSGACLQMLYGIEGAMKGKRARDLTKEEKEKLKQFYRSLS
ncbi:TfoX/Sxy family DNA transformation protein [Candidatus Enterococcus mangumiae]|uniref:TfoX C-terminal domain-containing protein n=1 Tax=Candidatus Enterococcus mangumiae TaxID=2230878 RepID=A0ABZ2T0H8_9ENTE|nr:TfoX/Sxy family DNA transformation protein [Enterococcus sp. DIV1094]MBO0489939.1 TfoX/Sxy family DNA transformation protein [Enterococcus sp. DIV1094]